ncbi:MAG: hypothetical protein H0W86_07845 [Armatimonadetes bacterium]|nr:hypothetical protein [Armatimonadota bacterium]
MLKKLLVLSAVGITAIALADILAVGSYGHGTTAAHDGRVGSFDYSVSKRTAEGHPPQFEGRLRFEQYQNHAGRWVVIEMGTPAMVGVIGNVCEFAGRGSLTRERNGHQETVYGHVSVRVVDRRNLYHPHNDPDVFRITFQDAHQNTFSFDGLVDHGDLVVFSRREH